MPFLACYLRCCRVGPQIKAKSEHKPPERYANRMLSTFTSTTASTSLSSSSTCTGNSRRAAQVTPQHYVSNKEMAFDKHYCTCPTFFQQSLERAGIWLILWPWSMGVGGGAWHSRAWQTVSGINDKAFCIWQLCCKIDWFCWQTTNETERESSRVERKRERGEHAFKGTKHTAVTRRQWQLSPLFSFLCVVAAFSRQRFHI